MVEPYYDCDGITIYNADCREVLPYIADGSINLICTDPPYFKVKNEWWDRQWEKPDEFLNWIGELCEDWQRVLSFNGSLYVFASPQMAWGVEGEVRKRFKVLSSIRWVKNDGWHKRSSKEELRGYFPNTESIVFAEQHGADGNAMNGAGYTSKCDELRGFVFEPLRAWFVSCWERSGLTRAQVDSACGTSNVSQYWFLDRNYQIPTAEKYAVLQRLAPDCFTREYEDLRREYEDLRREYEDLRREYEDLRREYEDLRRPFSATKERPYTDVWEYETVQKYKGKHPCEKPKRMMDHIVLTSSREGDTVLDCFGGSMRLAESCKELGRKFIGIEINEEYCETAVERLAQGVLF